MDDYIKREDAIKALEEKRLEIFQSQNYMPAKGVSRAIDVIYKMPSADIVPKKKWLLLGYFICGITSAIIALLIYRGF